MWVRIPPPPPNKFVKKDKNMSIEKEDFLPAKKEENKEERSEKDKISEKLPVIEKDKEKEKQIREYLSKLKTSVSSSPVSTRDEKVEIENLSSGEQVGALISLAFEKGLKEATSIAVSLDNPAIIDEFHDALIDQHYNELVDKKIIEEPK